jgi:exonuclease SbcC
MRLKQRARDRLEAEKLRETERRAVSERLDELERWRTMLVAWREARDEYDAAVNAMAAAETALQDAREVQAAVETRRQALKARADAAEAASLQLEGAQRRLDDARRTEERCRRLAQVCGAVTEAVETQDVLQQAEERAGRGYAEAQEHVQVLEGRWAAGRAAVLAGALTEGEPCPVCGSTHHPAPAFSSEALVSDDELVAARAALAAAGDEYEVARRATAEGSGRLARLRGQEESLLAEAKGANGAVDIGPIEAAAVVGECKAVLEYLQEIAATGVLQDEARGVEAQAVECQSRLREAETACSAGREMVTRTETRVQERAAGIPAGFTQDGALEDALVEAKAQKTCLDEALVAVEEAAQTARDALARRQEESAAATGVAAAAAAQELNARRAFHLSLAENKFADEAEWRACLIAQDERAAIERQLASYQEELQLARGRLLQAEKHAAAQPVPADLEELRTIATEARTRHEVALAAHADAKSHLSKLQGVLANLSDLDEQSEEIRVAYAVAGTLAETAAGQNDSRVSFQRWVLGVYLDEVLAVASRKLHGMSKGRYRFERQREAQNRRRPSGLDIAVFDEFSGAARPAVTLSGGESFLAALSLALGLAETVQEHSAGTPLETIFIDEGFGSLDPDALELALDALMELQLSGRLVGVISHVGELKQVMPARLEVRGGLTGSTVRFVVP